MYQKQQNALYPKGGRKQFLEDSDRFEVYNRRKVFNLCTIGGVNIANVYIYIIND